MIFTIFDGKVVKKGSKQIDLYKNRAVKSLDGRCVCAPKAG